MSEITIDGSKEIKIYSAEGCEPCDRLVAELEKRGIKPNKIDITKDDEARARIQEKYGIVAVPVIEIDGELKQIGI